MIFTHPQCFQCFPTQENLTIKTLNPKVPSFAVPSFSLFKLSVKICKEHLYSSLQLTKSCHVLPNRNTVGAYNPRYDQPYPENVPNKPKIVSCFPKIVSRLDTLQNHAHCLENCDTLTKSCHDSKFSQLVNFESYTTFLHLDSKLMVMPL